MIRRIILAAAVLVILAGAAVFCFGRPGVRFAGDRVRNTDPERYYLRFAVLNADEEETLSLREGDVLRVSWRIESGSMDLSVSMDDEAPVYQANGRSKGDEAGFGITIPRTGEYRIRITGMKARGWIEFVQEPAGSRKEETGS